MHDTCTAVDPKTAEYHARWTAAADGIIVVSRWECTQRTST